MGKKVSAKKKAKFEEQQYVEDLDLDVEQANASDDDELHVVHNRKRKRTESKRQTASSVLPVDAHQLDGYGDNEFGFMEENDLAIKASKELKSGMSEEDFEVPGLSIGDAARKATAQPTPLADTPVIETIERDFAVLSSSERLKLLKKESPELLKLLEDLDKYLKEVKALSQPLHHLLHQQKLTSDADRNLVSFLETKVQLMLSYCMHVTFYLLLKSEGKKVADHPVIDTLVEIRLYLEKMWPLEEKLQYSLNRVLSGKTMAAVEVEKLRPVAGDQITRRSEKSVNASERRRLQRSLKEAEDLEQEELATMTRVQTKKASLLNSLNASSPAAMAAVAPLSYREDEDQFFSRLMRSGENESSDDEGEGVSLIESLRRRQAAVSSLPKPKERRSRAEPEDEEGEDEDEEDFEEGSGVEDDEEMDDADAEDYDELLREEKERNNKRTTDEVPRQPREVQEVDRRKAGKRIEAHRGLTKARPKDRKNPRLAQKRKYERGMQVHKSQTRTHKPEEEGGFAGVSSIKPGVVRGRKLV